MMENIKEIPYGIANFVEVAEQNMYYVDKTMYLPLLEKQPRNLFFIRPRRFGKSIFLSMLRAYYDIAQKEKFQKRFGNLWIGSRPTPLQGKFQVVYLDFSARSGGSGSLEENFNNYCGMVMDLFGKVYEPYYFPGFAQKMEEQPDFVSKLNYLNLHAAESGMRLYLIIDEYDNFTNIVLNEQGKDIYHALTHASGFYREIFKKFQRHVRAHLHDRRQPRHLGRPDQRIQHRLEYQYRLPVQHDAGIQRNGRAHHVPIL